MAIEAIHQPNGRATAPITIDENAVKIVKDKNCENSMMNSKLKTYRIIHLLYLLAIATLLKREIKKEAEVSFIDTYFFSS